MDPDTILDLFDDGERLTTPEVAAGVGISQRAAWVYLSRLVEDGRLEREPGTGLKLDTWARADADE